MRPAVDSTPLQAIALMVCSSFLISIGDALVTGWQSRMSVSQLYVMRGAIAVPLLLAIVTRGGRPALRVHRPAWLVLRSLLMVTMWALFYAALPSVGLALTSAGLYTFPLFVLLFGRLGGVQRLTVRTVSALALGFAGTLLIVQPTGARFSAAYLLPIGAAICYALQALVTRYRCSRESPWMLALGMNLAFVLTGAAALAAIGAAPPVSTHDPGLAFIVGGWHAADATLWAVAAVLAAIIIGGSATMARAYQMGDPPTIAAFDYSHLLFATLWGRLFFGESIGALALTGMLAVTAAGLVTLRRPGQAGRRIAHAER